MAKILIVEDEEHIREILKEYLTFEGYEFDEAEDGLVALEKLKQDTFDLVLLDVMMPRVDGVAVLRELRKTQVTPVILLTARGEEYDKLFGFELGADDYIVKPFSPREVMARVKAVIHRTQGDNQPKAEQQRISIAGVEVDLAARDVFVDGKRVSVTPKEFDLLAFLCRNKRQVFSREQLLSKVWGYDYFGEDRTVDTHIKMLRNSLGKYRDVVKTVWGIGYKIED